MIDYLYNRLFRSKKINFIIYQYRYLFFYILYCGCALLCELFLLKLLIGGGVNEVVARLVALTIGILIAFILNVKFNFKVPNNKQLRSFLYFAIISIGSAFLNHIVRSQLDHINWSYSQSR